MLDLRLVRENPDRVREGMRRKGVDTAPLDALLEVDRVWREVLQEVEALRAERNRLSEAVGRRRRERGVAPVDGSEGGTGLADSADSDRGAGTAVRELGERLKRLEAELREREEERRRLLLEIPNLPFDDVPVGRDEHDNVEVRRWGRPRETTFAVEPHWDVGRRLGILDFERAGKIAGSRFVVYKGAGALLARGLTSFMLDLHVREHGYEEVYPPFLVNSASMYGTGNLPKFGEDAFRVSGEDLWLVPTAEVPVTNLYRDEILPGDALPIRHVAYTACFRSEAGAPGRDTRGLIRQHQFDKVELVHFVHPEASEEALQILLSHAEEVLRRLHLPYRVVEICTGDLGFAAARKYDLEVWMPSYGRYVEVSSCSNFADFQARRANIRFRPGPGARPAYVHTLNGSGLAVGRTLAAILENWQEADGSVTVPPALQPFVGGLTRVSPPA